MRRPLVLSAVAAVAAIARLGQASILIDGFSQGSVNLGVSSAYNVVGQNQSGVDTINGSRAVSLMKYYADGSSSSISLSTGGPLNVQGTYNYASLGYGYVYSGGGFSAGSSDDLNANFSNTDALDFNFTSLSTPVDLILTLQTDYGNGNYGYLTNDNPGDATLAVTAAGNYLVPFSQLQNLSIDLAKIDYIQVSMESYGSFALSQLSAASVPEPATAAIALLAGSALILRRRRT